MSSKIYTKSGDKGETSLVSGARVSKGDEQIDLYGEVDALNSHIGFLNSLMAQEKDMQLDCLKLHERIQNALFNLGSLLACESENWQKYNLPLVSSDLITSIEQKIDQMDERLPSLKNFILPNGTTAASYTHVVRTTCRKCERKLITFQKNGHEIPTNSVELLNRLSDYFFVLSRAINFENKIKEKVWDKEN